MPRVLWRILTVFAGLVFLTTALRPKLREEVEIDIDLKESYPKLQATPENPYPGLETNSKEDNVALQGTPENGYPDLQDTLRGRYSKHKSISREEYSSPESTPVDSHIEPQSTLRDKYSSQGRTSREVYSNELENVDEDEEDNEEEYSEIESMERYQKARARRAFGKNEYLLPENFRSLRRKDIPVTYRLHDDLLRYYRKGTRPVTHPNKIVHVQMTTFLYQIIKLVSYCTNMFS